MGQITKPVEAAANLQAWLEKSMPTILAVIPKHVTADRLLKLLMKDVRTNPKLLKCDPRSVVNAFIGASELGLEVGGIGGQAHLVPFKDEATLIIGYKGLMTLARRSGAISVIEAAVVYSKDIYEFELGLDPKLKHIPAQTDDRGDMIAAYAIARYKDGERQFCWMWKSEIDKVRPAHTRGGRPTPWDTNYDEMAVKTPVRKLCKMIPSSSELQRAVEIDEAADRGEKIDFVDLKPLDVTDGPPKSLDDLVPDKPAAKKPTAEAAKQIEALEAQGEPAGITTPEPAAEPPAATAEAQATDQDHHAADLRIEIRDIYKRLPSDEHRVKARTKAKLKNIHAIDKINDVAALENARDELAKYAGAVN